MKSYDRSTERWDAREKMMDEKYFGMYTGKSIHDKLKNNYRLYNLLWHIQEFPLAIIYKIRSLVR